MSTWDRESFYFSGQGVMMLGDRTIDGKPAGLVPVGNVSALTLTVATTVLEHKESQSGQRAIDLRLTTEVRTTLSATIENFIAENLSLAMRGNRTEIDAGSAANEEILGYFGKVTPLEWVKVDTLVITNPAGPTVLTLFVDDVTPWDYKENLEAGSIRLNGPDTGEQFDTLADDGVAITGITVATQAVVSIADTSNFAVGGYAAINGVTGTMSTVLNGLFHKVTAIVTNVSITINTATTGLTYTAAGTAQGDKNGVELEADYNFAGQELVDALETSPFTKWMRFEGLNTADEFRPVIIDVPKFTADPLRELAMIGDAIGQFLLEGNILADPLQQERSQFFRVQLLR